MLHLHIFDSSQDTLGSTRIALQELQEAMFIPEGDCAYSGEIKQDMKIRSLKGGGKRYHTQVLRRIGD